MAGILSLYFCAEKPNTDRTNQTPPLYAGVQLGEHIPKRKKSYSLFRGFRVTTVSSESGVFFPVFSRWFRMTTDEITGQGWVDFLSHWIYSCGFFLFRPSQICSKICLKCFQEFPKNFTYYASQCSYYACIMLLSWQKNS